VQGGLMSFANAKKAKLAYENDETVLCFHGPLLYEAKILKGEIWDGNEVRESGPHYFVHYKGWKVKWDEWVSESRIMKFNEINLQKKKELQDKHRAKDLPQKKESTEPLQQKKQRPEEPVQKNKEKDIDLVLPEKLISVLVDDWEYITKQQMLVSLPRSPTVADVLDEYYTKKTEKKEDGGLKEVIEGLKVYFDMALGKMLLYRFERQQYVDVQKKNTENKKMSEIYGTEHLLRLFVKIQQLVPTVGMEPEAILMLNEHLNGILKYIQKNASRLIMEEYDNAPPEYISLSKTF